MLVEENESEEEPEGAAVDEVKCEIKPEVVGDERDSDYSQ